MIKLYGVVLSNNVNKVRYCLDYLNLPYEMVHVSPAKGETQTTEYLSIAPSGKVPGLVDDGFKIFESNAINRYLAQKANSPIYPKDLRERAVVDAWMDYSSIHVGEALSLVTFNRIIAPLLLNLPANEVVLKYGLEMLAKYLPVADKQLKDNPYLAGRALTLADFDLLAVLDPCEMDQIDLAAYANITRWRNDLKKRDFYQKASEELQAALQAMTAKK